MIKQKLTEFMKRFSRFTLISWGVTALIVLALLTGAFIFHQNRSKALSLSTPQPPLQSSELPSASLPAVDVEVAYTTIQRELHLLTRIPERPRYNIIEVTVQRGDAVFSLAKDNGVTPESVLWANYDTLNDDPNNLRLGQVLLIPPVNGVLHRWEEKDTLESVADAYKAKPDDILNWPGNKLDLTNPVFEVGQLVMVPSGKREFKQWLIPTIARGSSGTASGVTGSCSGGAYGSGAFVWPSGNHYLSGNDYWSGHLGIDIAAGEGAPVYAADSGVVTMSAGGWNYGYGNVVMIDHGNGYVTLYAHLSQRNVAQCSSVGAGQLIAQSGNTGNSFGPHLHFEVRQGGGFINPWYVLPSP